MKKLKQYEFIIEKINKALYDDLSHLDKLIAINQLVKGDKDV